MTPAKPSLELLRSLTDEHVLRALIQERRLTRAEIAARTGISKPTVSESVKRLTQAGLLHGLVKPRLYSNLVAIRNALLTRTRRWKSISG